MKGSGNTKTVYAIALKWPEGDLTLGGPQVSSTTVVTLLGYPSPFNYASKGGQGVMINIPTISFTQMPCQWAWVFKLTNISN